MYACRREMMSRRSLSKEEGVVGGEWWMRVRGGVPRLLLHLCCPFHSSPTTFLLKRIHHYENVFPLDDYYFTFFDKYAILSSDSSATCFTHDENKTPHIFRESSRLLGDQGWKRGRKECLIMSWQPQPCQCLDTCISRDEGPWWWWFKSN